MVEQLGKYMHAKSLGDPFCACDLAQKRLTHC